MSTYSTPTRLEIDSGATGGKFWQIQASGLMTTVSFGSLFKTKFTQSRDKNHGSATLASKYCASQIKSKIKKGYQYAEGVLVAATVVSPVSVVGSNKKRPVDKGDAVPVPVAKKAKREEAATTQIAITCDLTPFIEQYRDMDKNAVFAELGIPIDATYECQTVKQHKEKGTLIAKDKDFTDNWVFLAWVDGGTTKDKKLKISQDGVSVSTKLLSSKKRVIESGLAYGKPLKMKFTDIMKNRIGALLCFAPAMNGNGGILSEEE